ncbi:MAG: hypothetical protein Q7T82_18800 [Armatimonadota bacterium]|nr:hypothetical protein [Armatimonadota bacterium]
MPRPKSLLLLAMAFPILTVGTTAAQALPFQYRTRPGTIAHALAQPDGTAVSLDTVLIAKIKSSREPVAYFVVRESANAIDRIVIITPPAYQLRLGMSVDVAGP